MQIESHLVDEILEAIWVARETGPSLIGSLQVDCTMDVADLDVPAYLAEMQRDGLVQLAGDQVEFTEGGFSRARDIIRRHRLAQRLLMDVLDVSEKEAEDMACKFEHILSEEVTDKVAAFLGNPTVDPNGRPIPPGESAATSADFVTPLIVRLSKLNLGARARVAFLTPSFHKRFDRLAAFGINPGAELFLHQSKPAFVVRLGETELALDRDIATEIFVKPLD